MQSSKDTSGGYVSHWLSQGEQLVCNPLSVVIDETDAVLARKAVVESQGSSALTVVLTRLSGILPLILCADISTYPYQQKVDLKKVLHHA